ncbi:MAG: DUF932 domain-containing protein [Planctomycetaceae bacterium]|nr:DUF932 domain-containing protein [Planctomycetaceae bacterium]
MKRRTLRHFFFFGVFAVMVDYNRMLVNGTPFSKAGQDITQFTNVMDAIESTGMDYTVQPEPAGVMSGGQFKPSKDRFHIIRQDTRQCLGVCKKVWKPLQNVDAFSFFQKWLDEGLCKLDTIGHLNEGEKLWILAKIGGDDIEIVQGDSISRYILLVNGHDGLTSVKVGFTPIRVTCSNMFPAIARSEASKILRFRHSRLVEENLDKVQEVMNLANQSFEATAEQYRELTRSQFNQKDVETYVRQCLGVKELDLSEKLPTRSANIVADILGRIDHGMGQDNPEVKGTWWAAVNGVNEYYNHSAGRTPEGRLNSLCFGQNAKRNADALSLALAAAA